VPALASVPILNDIKGPGKDKRGPMSRALVLNASFEPLCVVSTRRAQLVAFPEPSVVRLAHYIKVPYQARIALNRRAVFARDGHRCQYCGSAAENIDHVIPRSRGGPHAWDNVVAACRPCNTRKRDRLLEESGMKLRRKPSAPRERTWILVAGGGVRPDWEPYLGVSSATLSA
jgi:5-methylcytosine-specific restriction endonuclease McrA